MHAAIGYLRVSTKEQGRSGLGGELRAEKAPIPDNGAHVVWIIVRNYIGTHLRNHKMI
jgi:hypothetical protein